MSGYCVSQFEIHMLTKRPQNKSKLVGYKGSSILNLSMIYNAPHWVWLKRKYHVDIELFIIYHIQQISLSVVANHKTSQLFILNTLLFQIQFMKQCGNGIFCCEIDIKSACRKINLHQSQFKLLGNVI